MNSDRTLKDAIATAPTADDMALLLVFGLLAVASVYFYLSSRRQGPPQPIDLKREIPTAPGTAWCNWTAETDSEGMLLRWRCGTCNDTAVSDQPPRQEACQKTIDVGY